MVVNDDGIGAVVSLINNLTKVQTLMAARWTKEETARHRVALVQNLLTLRRINIYMIIPIKRKGTFVNTFHFQYWSK